MYHSKYRLLAHDIMWSCRWILLVISDTKVKRLRLLLYSQVVMQDIIQINRKGRTDKMPSRPIGVMNRKCVKKLCVMEFNSCHDAGTKATSHSPCLLVPSFCCLLSTSQISRISVLRFSRL